MTQVEATAIAAERLAAGRLVAFPTETVYGLGADASDARAVASIFEAKGRPSDHPLIVHLPAGGDPLQWARDVPVLARRLIERFWPGALTLILPRREGVGESAAGGQGSIGLRCPSHPLAQRVLSAFADAKRHGPIGVAAPSANRFGHVSPTRAAHVLDEFAGASSTDANADIFIVDGGGCPVGIESTIVDCSRIGRQGLVLLRPGSVTVAMIAEATGVEVQAIDRDAPRASGTLEAHYAPRTPLRIVEGSELATAPDDVVAWTYSTPIDALRPTWIAAPRDAQAYARDLYAVLRTLDARSASAIWVERPPAEWTGVNDRLMRAAAGR